MFKPCWQKTKIISRSKIREKQVTIQTARMPPLSIEATNPSKGVLKVGVWERHMLFIDSNGVSASPRFSSPPKGSDPGGGT